MIAVVSISAGIVSMKSGLEGRNNDRTLGTRRRRYMVSMKSGLEGRNNAVDGVGVSDAVDAVSMKSGLEGRNNAVGCQGAAPARQPRLNEVRPRRPEQLSLILTICGNQ